MALGCTTPMGIGGRGTGGQGGAAGAASGAGGLGGGAPGGASGGNPGTGLGGVASGGTGGIPTGGGASGGGNSGQSTGISFALLSVDKTVVNLGALDLGQTGVGTITVSNLGNAASGPLGINTTLGVSATGCPSAVPANASCTLTITATPTLAGAFTGTVLLIANPGAVTPLQISVVATVAGGRFTVSPDKIDIGTIFVGTIATPKIITIATSGDISDLTVAAAGEDVAVPKYASTCTPFLAAGTSCTVVVTFTAATAGAKSESVVISAGGRVVIVPVTAIVQNPARLAINPSTPQTIAITVGQASPPIYFVVENFGDFATGSMSAIVSGADAADFGYGINDCLALAPRMTCTVSVVFNPLLPKASAQRSAILTVVETGGASVSVGLVGTLWTPSALAITPATTDMGSALEGATGLPTAFTALNTGDNPSGALTVSVSSAEFVITEDTCTGTSVVKDGTCTFSITLEPATAGPKTAVLMVKDSSNNPAVRTITGTGIPDNAVP